MTTNEQFLDNLSYFWNEKGDLERFTGYDDERLRELDVTLWTAWNNYKLAIKTLNLLTENN